MLGIEPQNRECALLKQTEALCFKLINLPKTHHIHMRLIGYAQNGTNIQINLN